MLPPVGSGFRLIREHPGLVARTKKLWKFQLEDGTTGILRRHQPAVLDPASALAVEDLAWTHGFLSRLAETGLPVPVPLPVLNGHTIATHEDAIWDALSFLPGQPVGWAPTPNLSAIGRLLGEYHLAVGTVGTIPQRPISYPLAELSQNLADKPGLDPPTWLRKRCDELTMRLQSAPGRRLVIHGDFTAHNVLAGGDPPAPLGIIDFDLAHVDAPVADLAYGLWRSGRPHQKLDWLAPSRVAAMVQGYHQVCPLSETEAAFVSVYLWGRGVQMAARRVLQGEAMHEPPGLVAWIYANQAMLTDTVMASVA